MIWQWVCKKVGNVSFLWFGDLQQQQPLLAKL
jgi:hypothetical protein